MGIKCITLAFIYLCRIKNPEQLKHISPGEFGKLLGLDRITEARNIRFKISEIVEQKRENARDDFRSNSSGTI
ncbi:MAG: putative transposase [Bacteroidales bacterium]